MKDRTEKIIKGRIAPTPRKMEVFDGEYFKIQDSCCINISIPESLKIDKKFFAKMAKDFWDCTPGFLWNHSLEIDMSPEAYNIEVAKDVIAVSAGDSVGLKYAFYSLRQLAEPERLVREYSCHILPQVKIEDEPALKFRGVHLCWFPETEVWEIEKQIRLAAYYKMNYVVIESWGVFPFECEPDFCWQEKKVPREEFTRLVNLARELGVTLVPQLNLLGHASWARGGGGKHSVLNISPKYSSLYEPDGWCWCLSNPETRKLLTSLVCEIHDAFENPPYFHIGCDEAHSMASCAVCSESDIGKITADHICFFHNLLAERGARTMMWHDMLIDRDDKRWEGYVANGKEDMGRNEIYKRIPKDVVICDWEYDIPAVNDNMKRDWPVGKYFKKEGFEVLVCPWFNMPDTLSLGQMACRENLFGMLTTTWHKNTGVYLYMIFFGSAQVSWNPDYQSFEGIGYDENFSRHLRQLDVDMNTKDYIKFGKLNHYQINPDKPQH